MGVSQLTAKPWVEFKDLACQRIWNQKCGGTYVLCWLNLDKIDILKRFDTISVPLLPVHRIAVQCYFPPKNISVSWLKLIIRQTGTDSLGKSMAFSCSRICIDSGSIATLVFMMNKISINMESTLTSGCFVAAWILKRVNWVLEISWKETPLPTGCLGPLPTEKAWICLFHWSHMHPTHCGDGSTLDILNLLF